MFAHFNDLPPLNDTNEVRILYGGEPVSDDDWCAALHRSIKSVLYDLKSKDRYMYTKVERQESASTRWCKSELSNVDYKIKNHKFYRELSEKSVL